MNACGRYVRCIDVASTTLVNIVAATIFCCITLPTSIVVHERVAQCVAHGRCSLPLHCQLSK